MIKVGVVGGTGYTGVELLRLLAAHDQVEVTAITSRAEAGRAVSDLYPNLRGFYDLKFGAPTIEVLTACDLVFFATPNGVAMEQTEALLAAGVKVIDLSADFRIKDLTVWSEWYGMEHACPELVAEAVYGLPEVNREAIKQARLVANPGCYPTAVQLGFIPLLKHNLVDPDHLIADAKSGVSGAGRAASVANLLGEAGDSFKAYKADGHRHLPEIAQGLAEQVGQPVGLTFVPHLLPIIRGIHATLYATLTKQDVDLQALYQDYYKDEPFVDVLPAGSHPETRSVKGANMCRLAVHRPAASNGRPSDKVVVLAVEDNLVKGAAGQAIQNMNLMYGFAETAGLNQVALLP